MTAIQIQTAIPGVPEWTFVLFGAFMLLIAFQAGTMKASKVRLFVAALVIAAFVACQLYAQVPIKDPCSYLEPYSWEWWFWNCWISSR